MSKDEKILDSNELHEPSLWIHMNSVSMWTTKKLKTPKSCLYKQLRFAPIYKYVKSNLSVSDLVNIRHLSKKNKTEIQIPLQRRT